MLHPDWPGTPNRKRPDRPRILAAGRHLKGAPLIFTELFEKAQADGKIPNHVDVQHLANVAQSLVSEGARYRAVRKGVERRRISVSLRFDPVIIRLLTEHEPLRQSVRRLDRMLIGDAGYEARMPAAILTSALGVAALHPLVAEMDDETFRRQMLQVTRRIFDLPPGN